MLVKIKPDTAPSIRTEAIKEWNANLLPDDRHDKYCNMALSPFIFYRGSNHLFWSDFSGDSRLSRFGNEKTRTWLQGDLHAENFGAFKNAKGDITYAVNDFDDSVIADYQYGLWRMATSLVLVARQNKLSVEVQREAVDAFAGSYLAALIGYVGNEKVIHTHFTKTNTSKTLRRFLKQVERENNRKVMLKKWTRNKKGKRYFSLTPQMRPPVRVTQKLAPISESERTAILCAMPGYRDTLKRQIGFDKDYFKVHDIAQRLLAGTGSRGTPRYYVLIRGEGRNDGHILDIKLQSKPTAYHFLAKKAQNEFDNCFPNAGERHAAAYRALTTTKDSRKKVQNADNLLGSIQFFDRTYSVRERSPYKETFPTNTLTSRKKMVEMCSQWGEILATEHERSHYNYAAKPELYPLSEQVAELTRGEEQAFIKQASEIALSYADQVEADYRNFKSSLAPKDCPTPK